MACLDSGTIIPHRRGSADWGMGVVETDTPCEHPSQAPFAPINMHAKPPKPVKRVPERQQVPEIRICGPMMPQRGAPTPLMPSAPMMPSEGPMGDPRPPQTARPSALCRYRKLPSLGVGEVMAQRPQTSRASSSSRDSGRAEVIVLKQQLEEATEASCSYWWEQLALQMGRPTASSKASSRLMAIMKGRMSVLMGWKPELQPRVATPDLHMLDLTLARPPPPPQEEQPAKEESSRKSSRAQRNPPPSPAEQSVSSSEPHIL